MTRTTVTWAMFSQSPDVGGLCITPVSTSDGNMACWTRIVNCSKAEMVLKRM